MRVVIAIVFALLATAAMFSVPYWQGANDVQALAPAAELTLAKRLVQDLRSRNFTDAIAITEPAYRPKDAAVLAAIADLFPREKEQAIRVTTWQKMVTSDAERTHIEMFYDFGKDGAVRANVDTLRDAAGLQIHGANINHFTASQMHANDFQLPRTAWDIRWAFLTVGWLFDIGALATFVLCLMSPVVRWRWRWLWALFVLTGWVRFNLDWVSLQSGFQMLMFMAPPAGFYRFVSYGPWVLSISAPLGAMLYWAKRAQWRGEAANAPADIRSA